MAEYSFQEVMRQWVRARKATKCRGEENNMLSVYPLEAYDDTLIANIEEHVMQWAAKHPESVYPTWGEWLEMQDVVGVEGYFETEAGDLPIYRMRRDIWQPIPADIAEKLGLRPKEGV